MDDESVEKTQAEIDAEEIAEMSEEYFDQFVKHLPFGGVDAVREPWEKYVYGGLKRPRSQKQGQI